MKILIIASGAEDWNLSVPGVSLISPREYLTSAEYAELENARVINLCHNYRYQSNGYYVSLLAAARGHRPMPNVSTMRDLQSTAFYRYVSDDVEDMMQKCFEDLMSDEFTLSIYFGRNMAKRYEKLCSRLFNLMQAPLLRAEFFRAKGGHWRLRKFTAIPFSEVPESHKAFLIESATRYCARPTRLAHTRKPSPFTLGMLVKPNDDLAPSNKAALDLFVKAGERLGVDVEMISREDYTRVPEFDALFIRETTRVNDHTFRFARRAEIEGMPVIDDSLSILRCANKVYLAELLARHNVRTPRTRLLHCDNISAVLAELGTPCVLKQPDSSFSIGVVKADDEADFREKADRLLDKSDLIVAQEFLPTEFDWRVGILGGAPLFACKYFMAKSHWQIYNHDTDIVDDRDGMTATFPVDKIPPAVLRAAMKAARPIGDGLYGVDVKEIDGIPYVMEVNDNPNIDHGIEDEVLGNAIYDSVIREFLKRIRLQRGES